MDEIVSNLPGGVSFTGGTQEQHSILRLRGEFVAAYCTARGWNMENLTIEQLLEIRAQEGWKTPSA
jgi:hypothetical protein